MATPAPHPPPADAVPAADHRLLDRILDELRVLRGLVEGSHKPLLTVEEVARLTGRAAYTVRTWIKQGRLAATRIHGSGPKGRLLIPREQLDRLLAAGRGESAPDSAAG